MSELQLILLTIYVFGVIINFFMIAFVGGLVEGITSIFGYVPKHSIKEDIKTLLFILSSFIGLLVISIIERYKDEND